MEWSWDAQTARPTDRSQPRHLKKAKRFASKKRNEMPQKSETQTLKTTVIPVLQTVTLTIRRVMKPGGSENRTGRVPSSSAVNQKVNQSAQKTDF